MRLSEWLADKKVSRERFAARIGVTESSLSRYANGLRVPPLAVALKIVKATKGGVTVTDLLAVEARP